MHPVSLTRVIDRKRYSTDTATLLCGDTWWDGHNHERHGRQQFLYRTPRGAFFFLQISNWQGEESETIAPTDEADAITFFETCDAHGTAEVEYSDAFPGVVVEEA